MGGPWDALGVPIGYTKISWATPRLPMGYPTGYSLAAAPGLLNGYSWATHGVSRDAHELQMGYSWVNHCVPWDAHRLPVGYSWASHGHPVACRG